MFINYYWFTTFQSQNSLGIPSAPTPPAPPSSATPSSSSPHHAPMATPTSEHRASSLSSEEGSTQVSELLSFSIPAPQITVMSLAACGVFQQAPPCDGQRGLTINVILCYGACTPRASGCFRFFSITRKDPGGDGSSKPVGSGLSWRRKVG